MNQDKKVTKFKLELFILKFTVLDPNFTQTPITIGRKTAGDVQGWDIAVTNTDGYVNMNRNAAPLDEDGINGRAYPVPTNDIVTVDLSLPVSGDYNIIIYNLNGNVLQNKKQRFEMKLENKKIPLLVKLAPMKLATGLSRRPVPKD